MNSLQKVVFPLSVVLFLLTGKMWLEMREFRGELIQFRVDAINSLATSMRSQFVVLAELYRESNGTYHGVCMVPQVKELRDKATEMKFETSCLTDLAAPAVYEFSIKPEK